MKMAFSAFYGQDPVLFFFFLFQMLEEVTLASLCLGGGERDVGYKPTQTETSSPFARFDPDKFRLGE